MIEIMPCTADHIRALARVPHLEDPASFEEFEGWIDLNLDGPAYSVFSDGDLFMCGGVRRIWGGSGEAWMLYSPAVVRLKLAAVKTIKRLLEDIIAREGYYRVQSFIPVRIRQAAKMLEMLGFEREGLLRRYGPDGEDNYLYARVTEEG
jgi:hypothetical protein